MPQDFKDAKIITIYKRKGDWNDCDNYHSISLLSIAGKIFAKVLLCHLQVVSEKILPESQCGFRSNHSTVDMIFTWFSLILQKHSILWIETSFGKSLDGMAAFLYSLR